jgi:hypothetical protein
MAGKRNSKGQFIKRKGKGKTKQWATGPNSYVMPKFYAGQFRCGTPTDAVGMIHGSW